MCPPGRAKVAQTPGRARVNILLICERTAMSTLIDLAFTPEPDSVTDVTVEEHGISDHKCVLLSLRVPRPRGNRKTVTIRSTRNLNEDAIKLDFLMTDWSPVYAADCINSKWTAWLQIWNSVVNVHCPYVTKPVKSAPAPWLHDNPELRAALLARDCAHSRADRSGLAADWSVFHEPRRRASELLSDAKSAYFDSLLEDSKNIWREVRKYLLQKKAPATSSKVDHHKRRRLLSPTFKIVISRQLPAA